MANNSKNEVLRFATIICVVCSLLVSVASVGLRDIQNKNNLNEKRLNILVASGLVESGKKLTNAQIEEYFKNVIPVVVDFKTGNLDTEIDAHSYDMYAAAGLDKTGEALTEDPANIKRIAFKGSAYLVMEGDTLKNVVLPIQGYGLWSTMYGFAALNVKEEPKITGISFYQHAETPGLGGEIVNPKWQAKWVNKIPYSSEGKPNVKLMKSGAKESNEIDSLSGATLTSRGVQNMVNFWLSDRTYKGFIDKLKAGSINVAEIKR